MNTTTTTNSIVTEVKSAILHVEHLHDMIRWYASILSIPEPELNDEQPYHMFDMDNKVSLMLDDHRNNLKQDKYPICMMRTTDSDQAFAYVQENGIAIALEIQRPHHGLAYFNIADCEGNILMIVQTDWVNPQPQQPINPDHPIKNHISSIVIPVIDWKRATEWYSKLLGHPIKPDRQDGGPIYWFEMSNGTGILLDDNRNNQDFGNFPTFMLKSSNIHEAYASSQESGVKIVRDVQFDHYFLIEDPEGNVVMICL
jgi:predicted enzyme related to lactoylglutathione lyase